MLFEGMRQTVLEIVGAIEPFDQLETKHLRDTVEWILSGVEIFRIEKPAQPPKHLVSYFVVIDSNRGKLLLVDHIKAQRWLPAGGHVEPNEHPQETVRRELREELNLPVVFLDEAPILVTQTVTYGLTPGHTDVSLWYAVAGDSTQEVIYDPKEFNGCRWFDYQEVLQMDIQKLDPHMHRFLKKWIEKKAKSSSSLEAMLGSKWN